MLHVPASELQKQLGYYQDKALLEPVFITRNGRERTVLLSTEEYYRLKRLDESALSTTQHKGDMLEKLTSTNLPTVPPLDDDAISRENLYRFEADS
jgi:PHD/YefM family antitoxin component YafN of YafNO toxin-antitoxin module